MTVMNKLFVLMALLALPACSIKTPSLVEPGKQVTPVQLEQEVVAIKAEIESEKVAIKAREDTNAVEITKLVAGVNAKTKNLDAKVGIANADFTRQYERNELIFNTAEAVVKSFVPPGYAGMAETVLGLGAIAGGALGFLRLRGKTKTATDAVDVLVKVVKIVGATDVANAVNNTKSAPETAALIDERVKATNSDIL